MIHELFIKQLTSLQVLLQNIDDTNFTRKSKLLGQSSIGQHIRHTIELAQALVNGYATGTINYDTRKRDLLIETNISVAYHTLQSLIGQINKADKTLELTITDNSTGVTQRITTNYFRELAYNTEHTIHHMALIRVALREMQLEIVDDHFGVAPSTVKYRENLLQ
jgi:hypothetical protein